MNAPHAHESTDEHVAEDFPGLAPANYEYLDHTADIQLHAWGETFEECVQQCTVAMFGYMTEIETVRPLFTYDIEAKGDDMQSLLYHFLDEWLFAFSAEPYFIPCAVRVLSFDRQTFTMRARGWGESFDLARHPQGADVKAITYSNMQIHEREHPKPGERKAEVFVIVDI